jgi:uncharacterized protein YcaQ
MSVAQTEALRRSVAWPGVVEAAEALSEPGPRMRVLSPFDPALRDRKRAERLFGFHYRIEIFVPEAKRRYGYYVFPVLEGTRLAGRIDMAAEAGRTCLTVRAFWPEPGVRMGTGRIRRLSDEINGLPGWRGAGTWPSRPIGSGASPKVSRRFHRWTGRHMSSVSMGCRRDRNVSWQRYSPLDKGLSTACEALKIRRASPEEQPIS